MDVGEHYPTNIHTSLQCRFQVLRINTNSESAVKLHFDLVWCYKILFGHVDMKSENFLT